MTGGFATFKTDNEIGTSALLLVRVLAGIVAILQRIPKIKMGVNEIDPGHGFRGRPKLIAGFWEGWARDCIEGSGERPPRSP